MFKIILSISLRILKKLTNNPPIIHTHTHIYIYIYKIKNTITFKIKRGYYLKLLAPEAMELLGTTEKR